MRKILVRDVKYEYVCDVPTCMILLYDSMYIQYLYSVKLEFAFSSLSAMFCKVS